MIVRRTAVFAMALLTLGCIPYPSAARAAGYALALWPVSVVLALVPQRILLALWRRTAPEVERHYGRVLGLLAIATLVAAGMWSSGHADPRDTVTGVITGLLIAMTYPTAVLLATRVWLSRRDGARSAQFAPQLITSVLYAVSAALIHARFITDVDLAWLVERIGVLGAVLIGVFVLLCAEALIRSRRRVERIP